MGDGISVAVEILLAKQTWVTMRALAQPPRSLVVKLT